MMQTSDDNHQPPTLPDAIDRYITIRRRETWRSDWVENDGLTLHIREWAGEQRAFVLVHGLASNCRTWEMVAQYLAAAGHHVVTIDQRGHGLSDKPDDGYDFDTVSQDLALLIDTLTLEQPIIAGQSWGGNVMLAFGAKYPHKAHGLGFIDGGTIDLQMRPNATWDRTSVELRPPPLTGMKRSELAMRIHNMHPDWGEQGVEATLANFETLEDGTVRPWLTLERHLQILRSMWEQRPPELYPLVRSPVLICKAEDLRNPEWTALKHKQVDAAIAGLPKGVVHWFEDTDHDIHIQRPKVLADLFLEHLHHGVWASK